MKVFITGAQGFIGKELVAQCNKVGIDVIAVDLTESKKENHFCADIRLRDIVDIIPDGADAVIHLAGLTRDPDCKDRAYDCFNSNVMATLNLIDAAQKKNVNQFIFASSEWVYGDFEGGEIKDEDSIIDISKLKSEYALSKIVSEVNLRQKSQHGFCHVTILRFGIIYGSREKGSAVESIFNTVRDKEEVKVGSLKTGRCFIHVADIVSGIIRSIGLSGFNVLNLQGDKLITLCDIINVSKKVLDKNPAMIESAPDNVSIRNVSNQKAKKLLDWKPEINLEMGLSILNDWVSRTENE